jgi:hypothetical protein
MLCLEELLLHTEEPLSHCAPANMYSSTVGIPASIARRAESMNYTRLSAMLFRYTAISGTDEHNSCLHVQHMTGP